MAESPLLRALRRVSHPVYRRLETCVHPLRYLFLEITQQCNLRCRHCGSDCGSAPGRGELALADWREALGQAAADFSPPPFLVLTGGEPLCREDWPALAEELARRNLPWGLVSNGFALDAGRAARLAGCGAASVTVSLDGLEAAHDALRQTPGSWRRALAALGHLARAGVRHVEAVTCVHPGNLAELPALEELVGSSGANRWRLFPIFPRGRARGQPDLALGPAGFRALFAWLAARRRARRPGEPALDFCCEGYLPPALDAAVRDEPYFCRAGISIGSVLSDGAIAACPNISRALAQGSILRERLRAVWEGRFAPFRDRRWRRAGQCARCRQWNRCQGNSAHLWEAGAEDLAFCHFREI